MQGSLFVRGFETLAHMQNVHLKSQTSLPLVAQNA
ncbi:hypothetical protein SAMN05443246_3182 [Paenibacillus sp. GP183]|nr:hypothetical protein SAMN05443246_3182 [Paenibacillus sp. GP183]